MGGSSPWGGGHTELNAQKYSKKVVVVSLLTQDFDCGFFIGELLISHNFVGKCRDGEMANCGGELCTTVMSVKWVCSKVALEYNNIQK